MMRERFLHPTIWHILALYALLAMAFSIITPIFEAPDELQHVYVIKHLAETRTLPVLQPGAGEGEALYGQEAGQPPLYYAVGAAMVAAVDMGDAPPERNPHANIGNPLQPGNKNIVVHTPAERWPWRGLPLAVHLLRLYSILLGAGTVFFAWKIVDGLFPGQEELALAAAACVAFLPQFLFISAAVTNDNLITFLATFVLWLVLYWFGPRLQRAPTWPEALLLGMFLGFAALSKLSGLYLWGLVALAYLVHAWTSKDWGDSLASGALTLFAAGVIASPWFWRNWQLYGDPTALQPFLAIMGPRPTPIHPRTEFQGLRISLLGLFGWFNIPLPEGVYQVWNGFLAVSAIGFLQGVWRRRFRLRPLRRHAFLILLAAWLGVIFLALIRWTMLTPGTQGRLLFPALVSLSALVMLGWREWLPGKRWWLALPPTALLALALFSVAWTIPSAYRYPDLIPPEAIPPEARRAPITYDGRIQLLGAQVRPATVHPGDSFELTLYWRRVDAIPYNASLFIHVLSRDFKDAAQVNSYPGWGNAPTRTWPPDQVLADRYRIDLPGGLETPTKLIVDVGLYDMATQEHYPGFLDSGQAPPLGMATLRALPATPSPPAIAHPTDFRADDLIQLAGFDLPGRRFQPGETLPLTLYWRALRPPPEDYQVFVHLIDARGQQVAGFDKAPLDGWWPASMWEPGQTFADAYPLPLPDDLPPGEYEVRAGLYRLSDLVRLPLTSESGQTIDGAAVLTKITLQP
ncbi:MAG TPA: DUF2142 domain-containing protein [Caldilineales bacterium]|nr:DUF2142 domain-containing protein [Caldilineales bacterium]